MLAFVRRFEGVVDARNDEEKVRERRTDLVGDYTASRIVISSLKWIDLSLVSYCSGVLRLDQLT
jgi:hypothetical protein